MVVARCGNTGVIVGSEWCGLCRVRGCEGYKIYKQKYENDKQRSNKLYNIIERIICRRKIPS